MATLTLTVLGCSGTWASATSGCSGYLVDDGSTRVWVDCGSGSVSALQHHCEIADVDALVITHEHPDHVLDVAVLRNAMVYGLGLEGLPLYAPQPTLDHLAAVIGGPLAPPFVPRAVADGDEVEVATLRLRFSRTDHPVETLAVRVDPVDGSSGAIAYSSDTGPGWSLAALGPGIALAVVEATFLEATPNAPPVHRTAAVTGADARSAGVMRLVITHITPSGDPEAHRAEAEAAFGASVEVAIPHARYALG